MSQQVANTPPNPIIALATLPQPQVISGTLGEQGSPIVYTDVRDFPSIMDDNLIDNVDFIMFVDLPVSTAVGTSLFRTQTPVKRSFEDPGEPLIADMINWSNFPLLTHMYWDCKQQLGFTFIGPEVIVGKILITYDPSRIYSEDIGTIYRTDRRKITTEWDLSKEKSKWIEVEGFKFDDKRSIAKITTKGKAWASGGIGINPISYAQWLHGFSYNLGFVELTLIQQIQKVAIYPDSFTIMVFEANSGSTFYSATDPRCQRYENLAPYANYNLINHE